MGKYSKIVEIENRKTLVGCLSTRVFVELLVEHKKNLF